MKTSLIGAAVTFLTLSSASVSAALVSADWQTAGDNLITRDTESGLEWLDLTVTVNTSYNTITLQFGSGGTYEGWALATHAQISVMFDHAGGSGTYTGTSASHNIMFDNGLLDLWGSTQSGTGLIAGKFLADEATGAPPGTHWVGTALDHADAAINDSVDLITQSWTDTNASPAIAPALVRTSVVPVPAAVWLFGSGLLGLIGVARRKKT